MRLNDRKSKLARCSALELICDTGFRRPFHIRIYLQDYPGNDAIKAFRERDENSEKKKTRGKSNADSGTIGLKNERLCNSTIFFVVVNRLGLYADLMGLLLSDRTNNRYLSAESKAFTFVRLYYIGT